ncbi:MAG: hypothetical protein ACREQI_14470 [Candidatus Binataceae bacterium]
MATVRLRSEEYGPSASDRMLGNFSQAPADAALLNAIHNPMRAEGPPAHRASPRLLRTIKDVRVINIGDVRWIGIMELWNMRDRLLSLG